MEEKAEGSEMRHIRINTGVVDVWLVKCEVLKCPPQAYAAGSTGKRESEVFYSVMILDGQVPDWGPSGTRSGRDRTRDPVGEERPGKR